MGDDDDDEAATTATTVATNDIAAYCDAEFEMKTYFATEPDVDFETATRQEIRPRSRPTSRVPSR